MDIRPRSRRAGAQVASDRVADGQGGCGQCDDGQAHRRLSFGLLRELCRPGHLFRDLGPNWYASVMGTGIVANAGATLALRIPGLRVFATVVWAVAAVALTLLTVAWAVHWFRYPDRARGHARNPVMAQFWGAPPMALMTVGTGTLLLGRGLIGTTAAVDADWVLWVSGTALGLVTACWIPFLMMTRHAIGPDAAFGGWLMPVVPPMVSAANGALLIPFVAPGQGRLTLMLACYAMFGISLFASVIIITQIWSRLVTHKIGPAAMVPTLWIVLGPLGQSITAAGNLGTQAAAVMHAPYAAGAAVFALLYGVPTWGFAMLWLALAAAITIRTARQGLPFTLTWWSFTFPLGTTVTGTIALAARTQAEVFRWGAVVLYALLVTAWLTVAIRTARGSLSGRLFLPATPAAALAAEPPGTLTALAAQAPASLTALPAEPPGTLTALAAAAPTSLTALPAEPPGTLTALAPSAPRRLTASALEAARSVTAPLAEPLLARAAQVTEPPLGRTAPAAGRRRT
jgi:C4-dicarboxylate transporter/malic acid transport protein